ELRKRARVVEKRIARLFACDRRHIGSAAGKRLLAPAPGRRTAQAKTGKSSERTRIRLRRMPHTNPHRQSIGRADGRQRPSADRRTVPVVTRRFLIKTTAGSSDIRVGEPVGELPQALKKFAKPGAKVGVVSDAALEARYGRPLQAALEAAGYQV